MASKRRTKNSAAQADLRRGHDPFRPVAPPNGNALAEREARKDRVLELYLKGWPIQMIAREVGIRVDAAQNAIAEVRREYLRASQSNRGQQTALMVAKIDQLERTYWDAWERSMRESVRTTTSREDTPDVSAPPKGQRSMAEGDDYDPPPPTRMITTTKVGRRVDYPVGNPAFLSGVQWCIDRRIKILGLDSPERVDVNIHVRRLAESMGLDVKYVEGQAYEIAKEWEQQRELPDASSVPG